MTDTSKPNNNTVNFGLDYDGTVTTDPEGFLAIVKLLRSRGHKVYVVTMRYPSECYNDPKFLEFVQNVDRCIPTSRQPKKKICESVGADIHIWIDDNPNAVYLHADQIWGTASPEGQIVIETHGN